MLTPNLVTLAVSLVDLLDYVSGQRVVVVVDVVVVDVVVVDVVCNFSSAKTTRRLHRPMFGNISWPPGAKFSLSPKGELCPLRGLFTPSFTPGLNTLYCLEE
jgi:hypothetical protein